MMSKLLKLGAGKWAKETFLFFIFKNLLRTWRSYTAARGFRFGPVNRPSLPLSIYMRIDVYW